MTPSIQKIQFQMADVLMYNVSQKVNFVLDYLSDKSMPPYLYQNVLEIEMVITRYHITDLCCDFRHNRSKNNDMINLSVLLAMKSRNRTTSANVVTLCRT